jgi:hypothetical protein
MKRDSVLLLVSRMQPTADAWPLACVTPWR